MAPIAVAERHSLAHGVADGHPVLVLGSHESDLQVTLAPGLGMVACSLHHRGEELLGLRGGLGAYAASGETMGVPLLYPWANRLDAPGYRFGGRDVALDGLTPRDDHGLPIHGLLAASRGWRLTRRGADEEARGSVPRCSTCAGARWCSLPARRPRRRRAPRSDADDRDDGPADRRRGRARVLWLPPVSAAAGVPREDWEHRARRSRDRLRLDARGIPTGASDAVEPINGRLGRRRLDDGYVVADGGRPFVLAGGGRRIEVAFEAGYPYAQVFAPCDDDVICFEPMTAPVNALRGRPPSVAPGASYRARFSITVTSA